MVYYNENDRRKAAWLRENIRAGLIAGGDVDERSIVDVRPDELRGYKQCHFFAGIGVWSYALRIAGWPDDRPIWTASCPCQPFSAAGKRKGKADDRHLWPVLARLVRDARPVTVVGEQVASKDGLAWLDDVFTDLEDAAYTCGAVDTCAAGYGAPHIRQRLYWVAYSESSRAGSRLCHQESTGQWRLEPANGGATGSSAGREGRERAESGCPNCEGGGMAVAAGEGLAERRDQRSDSGQELATAERAGASVGAVANSANCGCPQHVKQSRRWSYARSKDPAKFPGPTNGFWRDADWIACRDGKARPVEPGASPLAHGAPARVLRLRGYGDAIVAPQAADFIKAVMKELE